MDGVSYHVIDEFLSAEVFNAISAHFEIAPFHFIKCGAWNRVFRLEDGNPLAGEEVFCEDAPADYNRVPTGTAIDLFIAALNLAIPSVRRILARSDWDTFSVRPYMYPVGSGLGWHTDGDYAGAFIYYAHQRWETDWGGEFMIADEVTQSGQYIVPVPNRLIVLNGGVRHCIKKVERAAGDACRQTLTGFFYEKRRLSES